MSEVNRYVFTFHTKVKWGNSNQNLFLVAYFESDEDALNNAEWLRQNVLPNNMQVTVSKTLRLAGNAELPDPAHLTDEFLVKYLVKTDNQKRVQVTIPEKPDVSHEAVWNNFLQNIKSAWGDEALGVVSFSVSGKNIVEHGAVPPFSEEDGGDTPPPPEPEP